MFGDWGWEERRTAAQLQALQTWIADIERLLCIELGAGEEIPTVRNFSERHAWRLIRINPGAPQVPDPQRGIGLGMGALAGLDALLGKTSDSA